MDFLLDAYDPSIHEQYILAEMPLLSISDNIMSNWGNTVDHLGLLDELDCGYWY